MQLSSLTHASPSLGSQRPSPIALTTAPQVAPCRLRQAPAAPALLAPAPLQGALSAQASLPCISSPVPSFVTRAQSVDPLSTQDGAFQPGKTTVVHSPEQLKDVVDRFSREQGKLVILEAKSSHCRPCKKFASTYLQLAERFKDCVFLEVIGDESPVTRRMMVDMKVKSTPTFFLYRDGELVHSFSGIKNDALKTAILERLKPEETGRNWVDDEDDEDEDEE